MELLGLGGLQQPDRDQVQGADEPIRQPEPPGPGDRVPQRDRPVVLDQQQGRGRVVGDVFQDVPGVVVVEDLDAVGGGLGPGLSPGFQARFAFDAEADEGADLAAELDRLVGGEVAEMGHLEFAVGVFVDG